MNPTLRNQRLLFSVVALMLPFTIAAQQAASTAIEDGNTVSFEYTLSLADGSVVGSNVGKEPLTYTQGADQILPALERALKGMHVGEQKVVKLTADDAYGQVREDAFREIPLEQLPEEARHVDALLSTPGRSASIRVHEIGDETAVLDFNHPLAGKDLTFDIRITSVE